MKENIPAETVVAAAEGRRIVHPTRAVGEKTRKNDR